MMEQPLSLLQLNKQIRAIVQGASGLNNVWVVAETSDLRVSGGHCFMELIQKDADTGAVQAKMRAAIWASMLGHLNQKFYDATGSPLASGLKLMVKVNVTFHEVYGMSMVITDVNPDYTMGELLQRRNRMIQQLRQEGIIDMNRALPWREVALRVAVISAQGAAGYGDFINQLYNNANHLNFRTTLFTAVLQGERAPQSCIDALGQIMARIDEFDCVVIIRGGGAVSDLASFDNYDLAANVAQFPLPVIVGIGHERDVTILDYVANMRVKTPTAAAEWLIAHGNAALTRLRNIASEILQIVSDSISGNQRQLAYYQGLIPTLAQSVITRNSERVGASIDNLIVQSVSAQITRRKDRLDSISALLETLSPEATLKRGYSITRIADSKHALTSTDDIAEGTQIETILSSGKILSTTTKTIQK
jgi:exodeoxyribonuclease VII large subunit